MDSTTTSKDLRLNSVIEQIYEGEYQLPEFQRDYIWKDPNVKGLFESVLLPVTQLPLETSPFE